MTDLQNCMAVTVYACSGNETNMVWSVAVRSLSTLKRKTKWTAAAVQYHRELCYQSSQHQQLETVTRMMRQ